MARNIRWVAPALLLCWLGVTACGGDDDASTTDAPPTTTSIPEVTRRRRQRCWTASWTPAGDES